jgi:hypothetical protein
MRCLKRYVAREIFGLLHPTRYEQTGPTWSPKAA